jgi:oligopeptide/dipeptide ABC transporter ATP-binding protein
MMFQDPVASLSRRRSVRAQIAEPYKVHDMPADDDETDSLMELVGLNRSFRNRFPHELSGGQARRVGVARALTLSPKLIIADEPTAGLDVSVQGEILNLMRDLQQKLGISYLIVTHNLPVVQHVSDRIAVMYLGRLLEQGDTRSIFKRPAHPYTRVLLDAVPQPDPAKRRELTSIEGEVPSLRERPTGCEFHPRCAHKQERCSWDSPESESLADGRLVRCHFPLA